MDRPDPIDSSEDPEKEAQNEKDFQTRRQGAVYQGAFEAVIAFLVAALFGYWLDGYFGTAPVLLLIGCVIGFASLTVRLVRLGRWVEEASSEEPDATNMQGRTQGRTHAHTRHGKSNNENNE